MKIYYAKELVKGEKQYKEKNHGHGHSIICLSRL